MQRCPDKQARARRLLAAQRGRAAVVARLLQAGADASARVPRGRETALGLAAHFGDLAAAQSLVAAGADIVSVASIDCTCWVACLVASSGDCQFPASGCPRVDASAYSNSKELRWIMRGLKHTK